MGIAETNMAAERMTCYGALGEPPELAYANARFLCIAASILFLALLLPLMNFDFCSPPGGMKTTKRDPQVC